MTVANLLTAASAAILLALGGIHLLYTYHGGKLDPRDPALRTAMQASHPRITRETTVWRATKGFNATHSLGLMAIGLIYGYLALRRPEVLAGSLFLRGLGLLLLGAYVALAQRYFFSIPLVGVSLATLLYAAGWTLTAVR